jgi:hypothetical protein
MSLQRIINTLFGICAVCFAWPMPAATSNQAEEQIKNLVVVVRSEAGAGAGIVFGEEPGQLYILTANHVVRRGGESAKAVDVECRWLPGKRIKAQLLDTADATLDIAVLTAAVTVPANLLHFDRLGDPAKLSRGDAVFSLGHPNGNIWESNVRPDAVSQNDGVHLFFQSDFIRPGHSGGALLNDKWELVGLLRSDEPPHGEAIGIDRIDLWLSANRYKVDLRPPGAPSSLLQLENQIAEDVKYACSSLAAFPSSSKVDGEAIAADLAKPQSKVEADLRFSNARSALIGAMYRCVGGAYLLNAKLEIFDKMRLALPYLRRSLDYHPEQPLLASNVAVFEKFLADGKGDITAYLNNVMEVVQGEDNPDAKKVVTAMAAYATGPEYQAKRWLLHEATKPSLQDYLDSLRVMIKKEKNLDFAVEEASKTLPNGMIEVSAKVGPNAFSWLVDYGKKQYTANNEFTRQFMEVVVGVKQ